MSPCSLHNKTYKVKNCVSNNKKSQVIVAKPKLIIFNHIPNLYEITKHEKLSQ
jgi:hypothetical protein